MPSWKAILISVCIAALIVLPLAAAVSVWQQLCQEQALLELACAPTYDDVVMRAYASKYLALGRMLYKDKEYAWAIEMYKKVIKTNVWDSQILFEAGKLYKKVGRLDLAREKFEEALSLGANPLLVLMIKWQLRGLPAPPVEAEKELLSDIKEVTVYVLPFGLSDSPLINDLCLLLQEAYGVNFAACPLRFQHQPRGFIQSRNQYDVDEFFKDVRKEGQDLLSKPETKGIFVVTSYDITCEKLNFIFGTIDPYAQLGIISFARFQPDKPDKETLFRRIYIQSLSTAGFMFGVQRCQTSGCSRSYPHSFLEFKKKGFRLCRECKLNIKRAWAKINAPSRPWTEEELKRLKEIKERYKLE